MLMIIHKFHMMVQIKFEKNFFLMDEITLLRGRKRNELKNNNRGENPINTLPECYFQKRSHGNQPPNLPAYQPADYDLYSHGPTK